MGRGRQAGDKRATRAMSRVLDDVVRAKEVATGRSWRILHAMESRAQLALGNITVIPRPGARRAARGLGRAARNLVGVRPSGPKPETPKK